METLGIKIHVSAEEYEKNMQKLEDMSETLPGNTFWPSVSDIDEIKKQLQEKPDEWIWFCIYLHDFGRKPRSNEERYSKKNLFQLIKDTLVIDENSETYSPEKE